MLIHIMFVMNCDEICNNIYVGNKLSLENPHTYSLIINSSELLSAFCLETT